MSYIDGLVLAVPAASKQAYRDMAAQWAAMTKEFGATRHVQSWGDDVPDGKLTDFKRAVQAKAEEIVVFAWVEYPSKAVRDAANAKMQADPRMASMAGMPFDGKRMIYGGFEMMFDE